MSIYSTAFATSRRIYFIPLYVNGCKTLILAAAQLLILIPQLSLSLHCPHILLLLPPQLSAVFFRQSQAPYFHRLTLSPSHIFFPLLALRYCHGSDAIEVLHALKQALMKYLSHSSLVALVNHLLALSPSYSLF